MDCGANEVSARPFRLKSLIPARLSGKGAEGRRSEGAGEVNEKVKPLARLSQGLGVWGGYLLSHFRSTIGAAGFNFSVRNGKRWNPRAIAALVFVSTLLPALGDALVRRRRYVMG